ncbi:hypothetical protein XO10_08905 [Marinitoga sp. 1135]|uniref:hypothetical protein n=1 Tax=Marinitoga sp. 1135 TaxID=1643333 RepID=UPI001586918F|nr:hypothetical protein [Marinitoga sp. 1135]NUU96373.1 hypothetical protein [Marinitoga sp. 1135]
MRIHYQIQEQMFSVYEMKRKADVLIVGGVEIVIKSDLTLPHIELAVDGIGTRIATHLRKIGISPVLFDYIGNDEFNELINSYFEKKEILFFWSRQPYGTRRILKLYGDGFNKVYKDYRNIENIDYTFILNNLSEIINEVKSVYIILSNWNTKLIRNLKLLGKFIFLDFEETINFPENSEIFGDFIFINEELELKNVKYLYKITFMKNGNIVFEFDDIKEEIIPFSEKKEYIFEAKSAFKSIIINSLLDGKNLKDSLLLGNIAYSYAVENKGKQISRNLLYEEFYKRKDGNG